MRNRLLLSTVFGLFVTATMHSAVFTSAASGNYNSASTWTFTGVDPDGIPDNSDNVIISAGHTVTMTTSCNAGTLNLNGTLAMNGFSMLVWGNFANTGVSTGSGSWQFRAAGTFTGNAINNPGAIFFYTNYTIAAGGAINKGGNIIISAGAVVTNNRSITIGGALQFYSATSTWINATGSSFSTDQNISGGGILNCSASGNTFTFRNNTYNTVYCGSQATYFNLVLSNSSAPHNKELNGTLTVLGDLTLNVGVRLNCMNNTIALGGNWTNNSGANVTNMNTLSLTGSGTQTITRGTINTETFNHVTLNGTGTVTLNDTLQINGNLTINSGTLDVSASNFTIRLRGNFEDSGTFNARAGTVFLTGTAAQTIGGSATTRFFNLTSNNTVSVSVDFTKEIAGVLLVNSGSFGPSGFGSVVVVALGATNYGRIAPLGAGATLTGTTWSIQSFVNGPATAYWQYLSTPINGNLLQDWDGDTRFYMSGVGGNDGNACCPIFRSVRLYNEPTNTYSNVTTVSHPLQRGRGYMLWMADNLNSLTAPLIYDSRGLPSFGAVSIAVTAGGSGAGYNILGNPYACPITFSSLVASNPILGPNFLILQENGTYATNPNGGVIGSNQGFMVLASASGTVNFAESHKNVTATPALIRSAQEENQIFINVSNEVSGRGEQTVIQFRDDATFDRDADLDLPYIQSPYEDASRIYTTDAYGNQYLYNNIHAFDEEIAVPLTVVASAPGVQKISFQNLNRMFAYNCAYLEDTHTGTKTWLNNNDVYNYDSEVGEERRFILHFSRKSDCQQPLSHVQSSLDASSQAFMAAEMIKVMFKFEETQEVVISVYDISGKEIIAPAQYMVTGETINIGTVNTHGIYLIRIVKGNEVVTKKLYY